MKRIFYLSLTLCAFPILLLAQKMSPVYVQYIAQYKQLAIQHQIQYRIPAAITMAQGLLESSAGQSELARNANNHFGIKCTSDWPGETYSYSDDKQNECFRKYSNVESSWVDHSLFLQRQRYKMLYNLNIADYKSWAYGLKSCGYATDEQYPEKLIRLIETYNLQDITFDTILVASGKVNPMDSVRVRQADTLQNTFARQAEISMQTQPEMAKVSMFQKHRIVYRNGIKCLQAEQGETFASIAVFLNMYENTLRRYNDAMDDRELREGDLVYIYPKRCRAKSQYKSCYFKPGDTAWDIAQKYGIKLKSLYKMNHIPYGTPLTTTQKLKLR